LKQVGQLAGRPLRVEAYCVANPDETRWEVFKNDCREGYRDLVQELTAKQRGLCAFCEADLHPNDRQVEHWRPKRLATADRNLTFDITNLTASCENVTKAHWFVDEPRRGGNPHPGPNASCGPAKGNEDPHDLTPQPYSPAELPAGPRLFNVQSDGKLVVDVNAAATAIFDPDRLQVTVDLMNLNCTRLVQARRDVIEALDKQFVDLVAGGGVSDYEALQQIAQAQLVLDVHGALPAFLTTLRSYVGDIAESTLGAIPHWSATP